mgnify:CR=1 FL=1
MLALVFAGIAKRSGAAASEGLEQRLQIVETGAAGDFAAVGEGVAGGEVQQRLVDFFEAPMSLEREQAAVAGRLERAEVGGPIDFTETDGRAGGDVRGAGRVGRVADGVFDVEMEEAGGEADEVGGRGGSGAGDVGGARLCVVDVRLLEQPREAAAEYARFRNTAGSRPATRLVQLATNQTWDRPTRAPALAPWLYWPTATPSRAAKPAAPARLRRRETPAQTKPRWCPAPREQRRSCFGLGLFGCCLLDWFLLFNRFCIWV